MVRKVRVRSIAKLRPAAFDVAWISTGAAECEIDVMAPLPKVAPRIVAVGAAVGKAKVRNRELSRRSAVVALASDGADR